MRTVSMRPSTTPNTGTLNSRDFHHSHHSAGAGGHNTSTSSGSHILDTTSRDRQSLSDHATLEKDRLERVDIHDSSLPHKRDLQMSNHHHPHGGDTDRNNTGAHDDFNYSYYQISYDTAQRYEAKANNQNASDDDNLSHDSYHLSEDLAGGSCSEDDLIGGSKDDLVSHGSKEELDLYNGNSRETLNSGRSKSRSSLHSNKSKSRTSLHSNKSKSRNSLYSNKSKSREALVSASQSRESIGSANIRSRETLDSVCRSRENLDSGRSKSRETLNSIKSKSRERLHSSKSRDSFQSKKSASLDQVEACNQNDSVITYDNGSTWSRTKSISSDVGNVMILQHEEQMAEHLKSNKSINSGLVKEVDIDNDNYIPDNVDVVEDPPIIPDENENRSIDEGYEETLNEENDDGLKRKSLPLENVCDHDNFNADDLKVDGLKDDSIQSPVSDEGMRDTEAIVHDSSSPMESMPPLPEEIKYTLHRRHVVSAGDLATQKPKRYPRYMSPSPTRIESTPKPTKEQRRAQLSKIKTSLSSPIVYDNKTTFGPKKALDYVVLDKLPSVDSYSCRDDSLSPSLEKDIVATIRAKKQQEDLEKGITRRPSRSREVKPKALLTPPKAEIEDLTTTDSAESDPLAELGSSSSEQEEYKCLIPVEDDVNRILSECQDSDLSDYILSPLGSPKKTARLIAYQGHSTSTDIPFADDGMDSDTSKTEIKFVANKSDELLVDLGVIKPITYPPPSEPKVDTSTDFLSSSQAIGLDHLDASSESEVEDNGQMSDSSSGTDLVDVDHFDKSLEQSIEINLEMQGSEHSEGSDDEAGIIDLLSDIGPRGKVVQNVAEICEISSEGSVEQDSTDLLQLHTDILATQNKKHSISAVHQPHSIEVDESSYVAEESDSVISSDGEVELIEEDELYEYQKVLCAQQRPSLIATVEQQHIIEIADDSLSSCEEEDMTVAIAAEITQAAIFAAKEEEDTNLKAAEIIEAAINAAREEESTLAMATAITNAAIDAAKAIAQRSTDYFNNVERPDIGQLVIEYNLTKVENELFGSLDCKIQYGSSEDEIDDIREVAKYPEVLSSDEEVIADHGQDLEDLSSIMASQHLDFGATKPHSAIEISYSSDEDDAKPSTSSQQHASEVPVCQTLISQSSDESLPQAIEDISSEGEVEHEFEEHCGAAEILAAQQPSHLDAVYQESSIEVTLSSDEEETSHQPETRVDNRDQEILLPLTPPPPPPGAEISSESDREEPNAEDLPDPMEVLEQDARNQHHWGETVLAAHPNQDDVLGFDPSHRDFSGFSDDSDEGVLGLDMTTYTVHEISSDSDDDITLGTMPLPSDFLHSTMLGSPCMLSRVDEVDEEDDDSSLDDLPPPPPPAREVPREVLESPLPAAIDEKQSRCSSLMENIVEDIDPYDSPCSVGTPLELDVPLDDPGTYVDLSRTMENLAAIGSIDSTGNNPSDSSSESDFEDVGKLIGDKNNVQVQSPKKECSQNLIDVSDTIRAAEETMSPEVLSQTRSLPERANTLTPASSIDDTPLPPPPEILSDILDSPISESIEPPSPLTIEPTMSIPAATEDFSKKEEASTSPPLPAKTSAVSSISKVPPPIPPKAVPPKPPPKPPKPKKDSLKG